MRERRPMNLDDITDHGRRLQDAVDLFDGGQEDLGKIAAEIKLTVPEVRQALIDAGKTTWEGDDTSLKVFEVGADYQGETFLFDVEIVSLEGPMTLPTKNSNQCLRCNASWEGSLDPEPLVFMSPSERKEAVKPLECPKDQGGCGRSRSATRFNIDEIGAIDYHILTVEDIADALTFSEVINEVRLRVHLLRRRPPLGGRVRLRARVAVHPGTRDVELICDDYRELEGRPAAPVMDGATMAKLRAIGDKGADGLRLQIAPEMVGRPMVQEGILLTLLCPLRIPDIMGGEEIRGSLIATLVGDTSCYKTKAGLDVARTMGFGPVVQAENATRTGLTYSIVERKTGGYTLTWGILPRHHGRWALIDGTERWSSRLQGDLRSVQRDQTIEVDRVVHGRRPCAVRQVMTLNPRRPLKSYPVRIQSIVDNDPFHEPPDVARVDLWFTLALEDVSREAIVNRQPVTRPVPLEDFRQLVYWAWSLRPKDIKWTPEAVVAVKGAASALMRDYETSSIPLTHPGFRDTVCRVAAAYACVGFSTADGVDLIVTAAHVNTARDFLAKMFDALQLREYRLLEEGALNLSGGEVISTVIDIGERGIDVLEQLAKVYPQALTSRDLAVKMVPRDPEVTEKAIQHLYDVLQENGLIEAVRGLGATITPRGVGLLHAIMELRRKGGRSCTGGEHLSCIPHFRGEVEVQSLLSGNTTKIFPPMGKRPLARRGAGDLSQNHRIVQGLSKDGPTGVSYAATDGGWRR